MNNRQETPVLPFILVTSLFLMWGLANNMTDTLLAALKKIMSMSDFQTSWIQIAFYSSYFCLALPAALLIKKYTYKTGILCGLGLFIIGALLFYPVGSIIGVLLSKVFILPHLNLASAEERTAMSTEQLQTIQSEELKAVMGPYVGVALFLLVLWIIIAVVKMPKASDADASVNVGSTFKRLIKNHNYVWGVIAQFFYVGAQIGVWSFTIRYVMQELHVNEEDAATYYLAALILFMISRFICTTLMKMIKPAHLLTGLSVLAMACTLVVILAGGIIGVYALVGISGCMSLMFPAIYGLALQGQISDLTGSIRLAFVVPLLCFVVVAVYGILGGRHQKHRLIYAKVNM